PDGPRNGRVLCKPVIAAPRAKKASGVGAPLAHETDPPKSLSEPKPKGYDSSLCSRRLMARAIALRQRVPGKHRTKGHGVRRNARTTWGRLLIVAALGATVSGCRVNESDVQRWGTTEHGPDKLVAVMSHDKYEWDLRVKAGLELVGMKPRSGRRIGISRFV